MAVPPPLEIDFEFTVRGGILPEGFDLRAGIEVLSLSSKGDAGGIRRLHGRPGEPYPDRDRRYENRRSRRPRSCVRLLRSEIFSYSGCTCSSTSFQWSSSAASRLFHVQLDSTGMEIRHIVTGCRAAFDEVAVRPLFDDDERMLELSCARCIQPEITLERHLHMDALRHIDEGAAGPDGIVQCRKFMIIR